MAQSYDGFYARFDTPSKKVGSMLMGADSLVGDDLKLEFRTEDGRTVAWLRNKFDAEVGFLDVDGSRRAQLAVARDQKVRVVLSFVAYSDEPDPGHYWGEVAVICFNPAYAAEGDAFADRVAARLADGVRPKIDLGESNARQALGGDDWMPSDTVPFPKKEKGMAILKDRQSMSERMIEQGRARNKGCYAVSWLFIILVVAAIAYAIVQLVNV